jgi:hypothetical protein
MGAVTKELQLARIREIGHTLASMGYTTIDQQSAILGICRSTAWTLVKSCHKASGLSAHLIKQMLAAPALPPAVRQKILEYVHERATGLYGHSRSQCQKFLDRLSADLPFAPPANVSPARSTATQQLKTLGMGPSPGVRMHLSLTGR